MKEYKNYVVHFLYPDRRKVSRGYDFIEEAKKQFAGNYALKMTIYKTTLDGSNLETHSTFEKDKDAIINLLIDENRALKKEKKLLQEKIECLENGEKIVKQDNSKNAQLIAIIGLYRSAGMSFQTIADKLNTEGHTNSRGNAFNKMTVQRLFKKYEVEQQLLLLKK